MNKRMTKAIALLIVMMLTLIGTVHPVLASEASFSTKKTYTLKTQVEAFGNSLWGAHGEGDVKSKTLKIKVEAGALYIDSMDFNTPFTITITDSKKKTVKTLKSEKYTVVEMGEEATFYRVFNGVNLSKGTYNVTFKSSSKKKLNGSTSLVLLSNKSKTIDIMNQTDIVVTKGKTYKFSFNIAKAGTYSIFAVHQSYELDVRGLEDVEYKILDKSGKVIATKKKGGDSALQKKLSAGDYTLQLTANKDGVISLFASLD